MSVWWRRSAVEVDTLSWLTSSLVTVWVSVVIVLLGAGGVLLGGQGADAPLVQLLAILLMAIAGLLVHVGARPSRVSFGHVIPWVTGLFAGAGVLLSGWGIAYAGTAPQPVIPELWWAPVGSALIVMSLSPFLAGRVFLPVAALVITCSVVAATIVALRFDAPFPAAQIVVASSATLFSIIGGSLLTRTLVDAVQGWRSGYQLAVRPSALSEPALAVVDRVTEGLVGRDAVPFLQRIARSDTLTPEDRQRAQALAESVRAAIVDRDAQSWLSAVTARRPVHVTDPGRLADRVSVDQRAAIVALIDGVFADQEAGVYAARLELAPGEASTVAVAVTLDLELPEGRRTAVLAPYYLTAKSVVRDITWRNGRSLVVSFGVDSDRPIGA